MLAVAQTQVPVEMRAHGDRASAQGRAPADPLDLRAAVLKLHGVVALTTRSRCNEKMRSGSCAASARKAVPDCAAAKLTPPIRPIANTILDEV